MRFLQEGPFEFLRAVTGILITEDDNECQKESPEAENLVSTKLLSIS
jgi:hypothetical protein